jgi:hypothetical protein
MCVFIVDDDYGRSGLPGRYVKRPSEYWMGWKAVQDETRRNDNRRYETDDGGRTNDEYTRIPKEG